MAYSDTLWTPDDDITDERLNDMIRRGIYCSPTTDPPTDPEAGTYWYQTNVGTDGQLARWWNGQWIYDVWSSLDWNADAIVGTFPDDAIKLIPVKHQNWLNVTVANDAGDIEIDWPLAFPSALMWYSVNVASYDDNAWGVMHINVDLTKWQGKAIAKDPTTLVDSYMTTGQSFRICYEAIGV